MNKKIEFARGRNWQKARIVSNVVDTRYLTEEERQIIKEIFTLKKKLLDNWDKNSVKLGLSVVRYTITVHTIMGRETLYNRTSEDVRMYKNAYGVENVKNIIKEQL